MALENGYHPIGYLVWARSHLDTVKFDLARSNLRGFSKEELGFTPDDLQISRAVESEPTAAMNLIAARYGLPVSQIKTTCGATMALFAAFEALLDRGDEVLLEVPNYEPLFALLKRKRASIKTWDRQFESGWQLDLTDLERRISRNTRAIVLTNLHNPTGVETSPEKLEAIGQIARDHKTMVIVDEVYLDNAVVPGLKPGVSCGSNLISVSSLSKTFGLGHLKFGWIATQNEPIMRRIDTIVDDYLMGPLPMVVHSVALKALQRGADLLAGSRRLVEENIRQIQGWVSRHNSFQWVKPSGGTVGFVKLPPQVDDQRLSTLLLTKYQTLVVPGHYFWKKGFIRISFGQEPDVLRGGLRCITTAAEELSR
jgi:aspartate/methionine/tyrosine aminotransferase